jgi:trk system potassium uptake protein TrkH
MRGALHLRQRYRAILSYVGLITGLIGALLLVPLLTAVACPLEAGWAAAFLLPSVTLMVAGLLAWKRLHSKDTVLTLQEGGVIVLLSWVVACVAGAVPFLMIEDLTVTQGVFESVSGWTTTGLSVVDVKHAHPAILLWRSTMQLAGGAGLAIIMLAAIAGPGGASLSAAEGRQDQLVPNVRASALLVLRIYSGYVVFGIVALLAAGMNMFDSINHSFCALSTGGFSTRVESIGFWDSPAVESVTILLMLFGGMNFITAWCLLRGKLGAVARNPELRLVSTMVPVCAVLLLWLTCAPLYSSAPKACRVAIFETVSAMTTTGYSTVGYGEWNSFGILVLLVLMLVGGATCSTAGAIKQHRICVLFRSLVRELRRPFLPRTAVPNELMWQADQPVAITDGQVRTIGAFVFLYLITWFGGAAVMAAHGYGLQESLFEFASTLGTVGLSIGVTTPDAPALVLWTQTAGMLLGRLEFFVIFSSAAKLSIDSFRMARARS